MRSRSKIWLFLGLSLIRRRFLAYTFQIFLLVYCTTWCGWCLWWCIYCMKPIIPFFYLSLCFRVTSTVCPAVWCTVTWSRCLGGHWIWIRPNLGRSHVALDQFSRNKHRNRKVLRHMRQLVNTIVPAHSLIHLLTIDCRFRVTSQPQKCNYLDNPSALYSHDRSRSWSQSFPSSHPHEQGEPINQHSCLGFCGDSKQYRWHDRLSAPFFFSRITPEIHLLSHICLLIWKIPSRTASAAWFLYEIRRWHRRPI